MENEGLQKTVPGLSNVSLGVLAASDQPSLTVINSTLLLSAAPVGVRDSSVQLTAESTSSTNAGGASTSQASSNNLVDRDVIVSVIRALQEKQRLDSSFDVSCTTNVNPELLRAIHCRNSDENVNIDTSRGVSLKEVSMQIPKDQSSRDADTQSLSDLSVKLSNVKPLKNASLLATGNPKAMTGRDQSLHTSRDVDFLPRNIKILSPRDMSSQASGPCLQPLRSTGSGYTRDVPRLVRDKTPDRMHSSKRRKAAFSDRDTGDSSDSSSRDVFASRTSTSHVSPATYDITRRHTDSPSSSCSSSLSAASSPGPNIGHAGEFPHRIVKGGLDREIGGGPTPLGSGEDVFTWAHSEMAKPSSATPANSVTSSSKFASERNSSPSQLNFSLRHVSPGASPRGPLLQESSSPGRMFAEFSPQKVSSEATHRSTPPECSPRRVLPELSPLLNPPGSSPRLNLSESSLRLNPVELSPRPNPIELSPRLNPLESSSRSNPSEFSTNLNPTEFSLRKVLAELSCKVKPETDVPSQPSSTSIPESSPRHEVQESSPRRVFLDKSPSAARSPSTPFSTSNNAISLSKMNFDSSSSESQQSKFEQRNGRTNERYKMPSLEKQISVTNRTTSSSSNARRSASSSPGNIGRGQTFEARTFTQTDTTQMTVEEILQFIRVPKFGDNVADNDKLKEFLDPHEIGHMNHLIKCFTDAIFSVTFPESVVGKNGCSSIDILDLYCCSIIRLYHLCFKNLDFINLLPDDQLALLKNFALKGILCMAFFIFKEESNSWMYPTGLYHQKLLEIKVADINQLLPYNYLQRILAMNVLGAKLGVDWPMGMLLIGAFFYCPIDVEIQDIEKIDKLRDRYMEILFKYLKWKYGSSNAAVCFPEILKLMDAVLKQCSELEHLNLALKEDEIKALTERIESLSASCMNDKYDEEVDEVPVCENFTDGVTFSKINDCILSSVRNTVCHSLVRNGGLDLRRCDAVPTASMYYSNLPLESEEAKSRREIEALLRQRILEKNGATNDQPESSFSNQPSSLSLENNVSYAPPQAVSPLAIQRLFLSLARKDLDVVAKQVAGFPFVFNQKATSMRLEASGLPQDSFHQPGSMSSVLSEQRKTHHLPVTNSILGCRPKPNDHVAEVTITRKSPPLQETSYREEDSNFSAIDLSKRSKLSPSVSATCAPTNTPKIPALKPLASLRSLSRSPPPVSVTPTESQVDFGLEERARLLALLNEVKKVGACRSEDISQSSGEFPGTPMLTSSQIEVLLETLGRSRMRCRNSDP